MDRWQLCHLAISLVLPLRPGEATGLLIGDVDWERGRLEIGPRLGGTGFTKGRTSFQLPFPAELRPLLEVCAAGRTEEPLLRDRRAFEGRRKVAAVASPEEIGGDLLAAGRRGQAGRCGDRAGPEGGLLNALRELDGVSEDQLGQEFRRAAESAGLGGVSVGALRNAVTIPMGRCRMAVLELCYLTSHSTTDVSNDYVSLDIDVAMRVYFDAARPLLEAITRRGDEDHVVNRLDPYSTRTYVENVARRT